MELLRLINVFVNSDLESLRESFVDTESETDCKITTFIFDSNLLSFLSKEGSLIMVIGTADNVHAAEHRKDSPTKSFMFNFSVKFTLLE